MGVRHILNDFSLLTPSSSECTQALAITLHTCQELGAPLALAEIEGAGQSYLLSWA